jgi:hypothetical protein
MNHDYPFLISAKHLLKRVFINATNGCLKVTEPIQHLTAELLITNALPQALETYSLNTKLFVMNLKSGNDSNVRKKTSFTWISNHVTAEIINNLVKNIDKDCSVTSVFRVKATSSP